MPAPEESTSLFQISSLSFLPCVQHTALVTLHCFITFIVPGATYSQVVWAKSGSLVKVQITTTYKHFISANLIYISFTSGIFQHINVLLDQQESKMQVPLQLPCVKKIDFESFDTVHFCQIQNYVHQCDQKYPLGGYSSVLTHNCLGPVWQVPECL